MRHERMLVGGAFTEAADGRRFASLNPSTGEPVGTVPDASGTDVEAAVGAARRAADAGDWAHDPKFRAERLRGVVDLLDRQRETLRDDVVAEGGVPVRLTRSIQLDAVLGDLDWVCDHLVDHMADEDLGTRDFHGFGSARIVRRLPVGVAAVLTPANFPAALLLRRVFTALATGNTVVVKPSPYTSLTALRIAGLANEAGLPPGVLNVVTAADHTLGETLCGSDGVDLVSLTGSSAVGRRVAAIAGAGLKRVVLYLSGKAAHVVLPDADPDVLPYAAVRACFHAGQACTLFSRLVIPRRLFANGVEALREAMAAVPLGRPDDPEVVVGPLVSEAARQRFLTAVAAAGRSGAEIVCGGGIPPGLDGGYFAEPTLVTGARPDSPLARQDIPGPLLTVFPYDTETEALALANGTEYGLAAAVTSGSLERGRRFANRLRAAAVTINDGLPYGPDAPYAAFGASGNGHNGGGPAFDDYLVRQVTGLPLDTLPADGPADPPAGRPAG
ncbi:aldehyde dehydrogenase family protein [Plantactinospora sp. S1510]|uniref:Aldehyde dehydrogenase family protein n=1 Tax=Plantactinospora alkalitolerans TaxID=2789879 RepID=A0ABS0GQR2_9ACTN|nr:aldehyde dehydrogenase family protein [Plantactinospora alkalitolerans]MBF9128538.1 aldehyde dehydrogenase family protein [Plantactinospora alkalitolerans]